MMKLGRRLACVVLAGALVTAPTAAQNRPISHPSFPLLGENFQNVLGTRGPLSAARTCGMCHDVGYISTHSLHANGAMSAWTSVATAVTGYPYDMSPADSAEMNCFLCHISDPANDRRIDAITGGTHEWAASATLSNTQVITWDGTDWIWNQSAFSSNGNVRGRMLTVRSPKTENCALCHGVASDGLEPPVSIEPFVPGARTTLTTGEVFSPQQISQSLLNIENKHLVTRSWDVHAERGLACTDCHHSLNSPAFREEAADTASPSLRFDPRRTPVGEYLRSPNHHFVGEDESSGISCVRCHDPEPVHQWLPYADRHMAKLSCESCHVPTMYSTPVESIDWTSLSSTGEPLVRFRGVDNGRHSEEDAGAGVQPTLLYDRSVDGRMRISPFNLVTSWYWVAGNPERRVTRLELLGSEDVADAATSSVLGEGVEEARERLLALGLEDPRIVAEVQLFRISHGTTSGSWSTRECRNCHQAESDLNRPVVLSSVVPDDKRPVQLAGQATGLVGAIYVDDAGKLMHVPDLGAGGTYLLGMRRAGWVDAIGFLTVLGVLVAVIVHGALHWYAHRKRPMKVHYTGERVYMYSVYERIWHWLQALTILALMLTGLEIHFAVNPVFGFALAVRLHTIVGFVVVANAVAAALFHFASGEIRRFVPASAIFMEQATAQARYYLYGIFHHEPHPFNKRPNQRLNPLQQITYLVILNVLLPLQVVTGILIWGVQRWPAVDAVIGGLVFVAPIHALGAWMFAAFLLLHVYLTTTGRTPTASLRAMVLGWDEVHGDQESSKY